MVNPDEVQVAFRAAHERSPNLAGSATFRYNQWVKIINTSIRAARDWYTSMFGEDGIDLAFKQAIALPDLLATGDDHKCQAVVPAIQVMGAPETPVAAGEKVKHASPEQPAILLLFDHVLVVVYVNSDASIDSMVIPRALVRNAVPVKVKRFLNSAPGIQFTVEDEGRLLAWTFYFWESHANSTVRELQDSLTTGF